MNERDVEDIIDNQLKNLGWDSSLVFRQRPKTDQQRQILGRKRPDYVLYSSKNSDQVIAIIEAKKPHENLDKAISQGIDYAEKLEAPIVFATDGIFTKSYHTKVKKPLFLNKEEVEDLLKYSITLNYIKTNEYYTLDKSIIKSRDELISIFSRLNNNFRDAGVRSGMARIELFSNMLFLKIIDELAEQENSLIKQFPNWCRWNKIREKKGEELFAFINGDAFNHFKGAYDGEVLSPISGLLRYDILNNVVDELDNLHLSSTNTDIKGDAFEYFLRNYGGAETDFGEYFTPRHVVKALVKILNPQFGESVYDPFCGTGGMLIHSFKHIHQRMPINEQNIDYLKKKTIFGGELTEMFRVAKMNMILTGDGHSNIKRQDSYESKQTGKHDVVITNIPFGRKMKTEYAINYGYNTKSAEITGVLHCLDALSDTSNARAGILVPEGVLFDGSKAYTALRQQIVEKHSLESVISLPSGLFGKNTGVKSNILVVKKQANKQKGYIWYFNVQNDGFTLDAKRQKIEGQNDIDTVLSEKELTVDDKDRLEKLGFSILYKDIIQENKYNLLASNYIEQDKINTKYQMVKLKDLCTIKTGRKDVNQGNPDGKYLFFTCAEEPTKSDEFSFDEEAVLIAGNGKVGKTHYYKGKFDLYQRTYALLNFNNDIVIAKYIFYILSKDLEHKFSKIKLGSTMPYIKLSYLTEYQIPLPSIQEQMRIVEELEEIDNSIKHAEDLVKSLKARGGYFSLYGQTESSMMRLGEISLINPPKSEILEKKDIEVSFLPMEDIKEYEKNVVPSKSNIMQNVYKGYTYFKENDLLVAKITPCFENGKMVIVKNLKNGIGFGSTEYIVIRANTEITSADWIYYCLRNSNFLKNGKEKMTGTSGQQRISKDFVANYQIALPTLDIQEKILEEFDEEIQYIKMTEKMIEKQKEKIKLKLNEIWVQNK